MKRSTKLAASIAFLIIFMSIGYFLLFLAYSGPVWIVFIVFAVYIFVLYFLILTASRLFRALREKDE